MTTATKPISEQAKEAEEQAVREVARLFQRPEDLQRLPALRQEFNNRMTANQMQLVVGVQKHVESAKVGMDQLHKAEAELCDLQKAFTSIVELCAECDRLIEHQETIQRLSTVNTNLKRVVHDVEGISAIPAKANRATELLNNNQLVDAFKELAELEGMSKEASRAVQGGGQSHDARDLEIYFNKVQETSREVEARLWRAVRDFVSLGKSSPALLVSVVRVIEMQEIMDAQQRVAGKAPKGFKEKALSQMASAVADSFYGLLEQCSLLTPSPEEAAAASGSGALLEEPREGGAADDDADRVTLDDILCHADEVMMQLADVYDFVTPCFPPEYNIFEEIWSSYHRQYGAMLNMIGSVANGLSNGEILQVLGWLTTYQETMSNLGVEEEDLRFEFDLRSETPGLAMLVDKYTERMEAQIAVWFRNIVKIDIEAEPMVKESGQLWTPGCIDFFGLCNDQVTIVQEVTSGYPLHRVTMSVLRQLENFLSEQRAALSRPDRSLEQLAASINNNLHCYEHSMELVEQLAEQLDPEYRKDVDVDEVARGFLEVAKTAVGSVAEALLADDGLKGVLASLYVSPQWQDGTICSTLVATINDYFTDVQAWVDSSFFRRICNATLQLLVTRMMGQLLAMTKVKITEEFIRRMDSDEAMITECFSAYIRPEKVALVTQQLADIKELASSDSVDSYVLSYTNLLKVNSTLTPSQLERLMQARSDMSKQDINEVMTLCRDVYVTRQRDGASAGQSPGGLKPSQGQGRWSSGGGIAGTAGPRAAAMHSSAPAMPQGPALRAAVLATKASAMFKLGAMRARKDSQPPEQS